MTIIIEAIILIIILGIWYGIMRYWISKFAVKIAEIIEENTKQIKGLRKQLKEEKEQ